MKVVSISHGKFGSINYLHRNFRGDVKKLRVTLEVKENGTKSANFSFIFGELVGLMPSLAQHKCYENWMGASPAPELSSGIQFKKIGHNTDLAHLVEHLMIDLICNVGKLRLCSGLTCGYKSPKGRFDIFVECPERRMGVFAVNLAVYFVNALLTKGKLPPSSKKLIELAKFMNLKSHSRLTIEKIGAAKRWKPSLVQTTLQELESLGFFNHYQNGKNPSQKRPRLAGQLS